jgi:hypothetical protein
MRHNHPPPRHAHTPQMGTHPARPAGRRFSVLTPGSPFQRTPARRSVATFRWLCALGAAAVTLAIVSTPSLARAQTIDYGFSGDFASTYSYDVLADYLGYPSSSYGGNYGVTHVRRGTPWDTVWTYDPSSNQCIGVWTTNQPTYQGAVTQWQSLVNFINGSQTAGRGQGAASPIVAIGGGSWAGDYGPNSVEGKDPNSYYGWYYMTGPNAGQAGDHAVVGDPAVPDTTTALGWFQYYCGVYGLIESVYGNAGKSGENAVPVREWEAWNEPDGTVPNPTNAAYMWDIFQQYALPNSGHAGDTVAAGTFANCKFFQSNCPGQFNPSTSYDFCSQTWYIAQYVCTLQGLGANPAVWSFHDYGDVVASGAGGCSQVGGGGCTTYELSWFGNQLWAAFNGKIPDIWVTEAAPWLNAGSPPVDNSPSAEADAAVGFDNLATEGWVTRLYYYELQSSDANNNDWDRFDSAMIAADGSGIDDGNPNTLAIFRPSYCVLVWGWTPSQAVNTPNCNDTIGFTGPAEQEGFNGGGTGLYAIQNPDGSWTCLDYGPFDQQEITYPLAVEDSDWEDVEHVGASSSSCAEEGSLLVPQIARKDPARRTPRRARPRHVRRWLKATAARMPPPRHKLPTSGAAFGGHRYARAVKHLPEPSLLRRQWLAAMAAGTSRSRR